MTKQYHPFPVPVQFLNPFASLEKQGVGTFGRINMVVPDETLTMLANIIPRPPGVIITSVNILYVKFINALIERGLTSGAQREEFVSFVLNCKVVDGRSTIPNGTPVRAVPEAQAPHVAGRVEGGSPAATVVAAEPSPIQQPSKGKDRRKRSGDDNKEVRSL